MGITERHLTQDIMNLGIRKNDMIYVHSSLKRIGWIENGPDTLIAAFLEVLGDGGTLAVPTHTCSYPGNGSTPYNPINSPSVVGTFTEFVRKHPRAHRSLHPSHSSAAIGAKAEYLISNHCMSNPFAEQSPLYRLYKNGGKVLLLGVQQISNTSLHMAEYMSGVGYTVLPYNLKWGSNPYMIGDNDDIEYIPQEHYPGCSSHFTVMEGLFKLNDIIQYGTIGSAVCRLMDAKAMVDMTVDILHGRPDFLLCHDPRCISCMRRREFIAK